jgi:DNA-binding response OmpR family regulator
MNGDFDVALIDSHHSDAKSVCMALYKNRNIPVVLVIKKTEANWKNYLGWKVDGFVAEECGKIELMARIQAIIRRKRYLN